MAADGDFDVGSVPVRENPLPMLSQNERDLLNALAIRTRTWRVMVQIVGPDAVGSAAIAYERALAVTAGELVRRDSSAGNSFIALAGSRAAFVEEARTALDPTV
jgi:hypothetical protein